MKKEIKHRLEVERLNLFRDLWSKLKRDEEKLNEAFHIARNMAASEWEFHTHDFSPTSFDPKRMDLLHKNFSALQEELSRKKYFLIKAFDISFTEREQSEVVKHWDEELKKEEPNLHNRFEKESNDE